jgi:hypothetical protein
MNYFAYNILKEINNLPIPRQYSVDEILSANSTERFFLRYATYSKLKSKMKTQNEIISNIEKIKEHIKTGELISIEKVYECIAGCAIYIRDKVIYGEYVEGHPIALLRRGLCARRFLIDLDRKVTTIDQIQSWIAILGTDSFNWLPYDGKITSTFDRIISYLVNNFTGSFDNVILEILITDDEIVFCDAKKKNLDDFSPNIQVFFQNQQSNLVIKRKVGNRKENDIINQTDCCDIDIQIISKSLDKRKLYIHNASILSHYITRNYRKLFCIEYTKGKYNLGYDNR